MIIIALKGLFGRRKDSLRLLSILFLTFLFSTLTSVFYTNSEAAKSLQRRELFGDWTHAAFAVPEGEAPFAGLGDAALTGSSRIIGRSPDLGTLAAFDEGFVQLANLNLLSGRLPQGPDEVALEQNQLSFFQEIPAIGDELLADTEIFLLDLEASRSPEELLTAMQVDALDSVLEGTDPRFREFFSRVYGPAWDSETLNTALRRDLPSHIRITPGNRENRRGLEHFEDTLLLPNEESLLYTYEVDLRGFCLGEAEGLPAAEQSRRFELLNAIYLDELTGSADPELEPLLLGGEGSFRFKRSYIIRRTLRLTGIYSSISDVWLGNDLPTALVTGATAEKFIEHGLMKTEVAAQAGFHVPVHHFAAVAPGTELPSSLDGKVLANTLAFPPGDSTDGILALSILVFIFFITLFGVFQLYMSQLNKRLHKLGLLRSVGATIAQVRQLLGWELMIILALTLPLAVGLGVALAWLLARSLLDGSIIHSFSVNPRILGLSILSGLTAVMLGVLQPLIRIGRVPLTGRIPAGSAKKRSARETLGGKDRPITDLDQVLRHHRRFARRQSVLTQLVYTVIFTAMILSLLLSFLAFATYRDEAAAVNMPDYDIVFDYALNSSDLAALEEELLTSGAVADVQQLIGRFGGQLTLPDGWPDPLQEPLHTLLPDSRKGELFVSERDTEQYPQAFKAGRRKVTLYGVAPQTGLFDLLNESSGGVLESDAFRTGRAVLMLYPAHRVTRTAQTPLGPDALTGVDRTRLGGELLRRQSGLRASYDFRYAPLLEAAEPMGSGRITVTFHSEQNSEIQRNILPPTGTELDVLAVVNRLPEFGIWPFSQSLEHPVVIGSHSLVRKLTESARSRELVMATPPNQTLVPTLYGFGRTSVWTNGKGEETFIRIQNIAHRYGGRVQNLLSDKQYRFNAALRVSIMVLIVALVISLAALQIQLSISRARVESERIYIGTLQSLGVANGRLRLAYVKAGLVYSLRAILAAHGFLLAVLAAELFMAEPLGLIRTSGLDLLRGRLWLYPWLDHLAVTAAFAVLGTLIYYLPLRRVLKTDPIHNIRHL